MLGKMALIIVCVGACACALLAMRQSRLQAAHELARAQLRVADHDAALWRVRAEIARRVTPEQIERLAGVIGPLRPMLPKDDAGAPGATPAPATGREPEHGAGRTPATGPGGATPRTAPAPTARPEAAPTRRSSPGGERRLAGAPEAGGAP